MNAELINHIRNNMTQYEQKLLDALELYHYQHQRYGVDYTIAIGATPEDIDMSRFSETIRMTDRFIRLDQNVCAVIFGFNNAEQGVKATSNMLHKYESCFFSRKIFVGIGNSEYEADPLQHIKKAFETLCYTISAGMCNLPMDYKEVSAN